MQSGYAKRRRRCKPSHRRQSHSLWPAAEGAVDPVAGTRALSALEAVGLRESSVQEQRGAAMNSLATAVADATAHMRAHVGGAEIVGLKQQAAAAASAAQEYLDESVCSLMMHSY